MQKEAARVTASHAYKMSSGAHVSLASATRFCVICKRALNNFSASLPQHFPSRSQSLQLHAGVGAHRALQPVVCVTPCSTRQRLQRQYACVPLVNVSLSAWERRRVALQQWRVVGGGERGCRRAGHASPHVAAAARMARDAIGRGGVGGAGCRLHSVFAGWLCCSASFTRLLPLLQSAASTQRAAAGARLAAEQCPRDMNSAFRSMPPSP